MADYKFPTEMVDLPSKGYFYVEGHPLSKGKVEVKYMTAKEEDILTSRTLLQKGLAIDRLLKNIMVDKSIDPSSLLTGDRNALIIAARKTGYGPEYTTNVTCPACATTARYEFDLNDYFEKYPKKVVLPLNYNLSFVEVVYPNRIKISLDEYQIKSAYVISNIVIVPDPGYIVVGKPEIFPKEIEI